MNKTVQVFNDRHANLDSFPLRYGFTFNQNSFLNLTYKDQVKPGKKKGSYSVIAEFINPQTKKTEKGLFHIMNKFKKGVADEVMTVIRDLSKNKIETEHHLSSVLRNFREAGVITVNELIDLHPLYMKGEITKHVDLYEYLLKKRSSTEVNKIKKIIDELEEEVKKDHDFIAELEEEVKKRDDEINDLKVQVEDQAKQIKKLNEKIKIANEEREKKDLHLLSKDYPSIDWSDSTVTSAAFHYWEVRGDFLCIFLLGIKEPIKLKNTFIYDYPVALEAVKKLLYGELFEYETKGFNIFSPEKWFSKIVSSDGYSSIAGTPMSESEPNNPLPEIVVSGTLNKETNTIEIGPDEIGIFFPKPPEGNSRNEDVLNREIWLSGYSISGLKEQTYTSDTSFKVIYCLRVKGSYFQLTFNHTWRKDMLILYTDKGWFIDTTVKEHGGTEWEEGVTYNDCKVSMTKRKYLPYWLQKKQ